MLRPIITIDEDKCNGCGQCITDCAEGALAIIDGKARLISQSYCDGLGACLNCPQGALKLETRDVAAFDEKAAMEALTKRKTSCPGTFARQLQHLSPPQLFNGEQSDHLKAQLPSWPIQLELMPSNASYLKNAHLLLAAHCSGFALPNFNSDLLKNKIPIIACPKLEDNCKLIDKLAAILSENNIQSITVLRMSVPCCGGLTALVKKAIDKSEKQTPLNVKIVQLN